MGKKTRLAFDDKLIVCERSLLRFNLVQHLVRY